MFIYDESPRSKIKNESMDLKKVAHFAIHTLTTSSPGGIEPPFAKQRDALNNMARQNRTKRKENLLNPLLVPKVSGSFFIVTERPFSLNLL